METYYIRFLQERCVGCHLCELACSSTRVGIYNPKKATIRITNEYVGESPFVNATLCDGCGKCVEGCPAGALSLSDGYIHLDSEICTSCLQCVELCPNSIISVASEQPIVCNMCEGYPACISWCPTQALEKGKTSGRD